MSSTTILFVGQHDVADDLNFGFSPASGAWQSKFANTGNEALNLVAAESIDIVVSELLLADMTGVDLLRRVQANTNASVRIILTGVDDRETAVKSLGVAHQIIAKPVKIDDLKSHLASSLSLRHLLADKGLQRRIAAIDKLPAIPAVYDELVAEMQSESCSMQKVAQLIRQDVAITAKILQMINSAFFGVATRVENPLQAVNLLGLDTVKSLVLTAGVFSQFKDPGISGFSIDDIYNHSLIVGAGARHFAKAFGLNRKQSEDALTAGMLHDIGKLVLLTNFAEEVRQMQKVMIDDHLTLHQAELKVLGATHCEIGAHLLSLWGLTDQILEAVALHDDPQKCVSPAVNVLAAVHVANAIDHDNRTPNRDPKATYGDVDYLTKIGLIAQMPYLRSLSPTP